MYFENKYQPILSEITKNREYYGFETEYRNELLSCVIPESIGNYIPKAVSVINGKECPNNIENSLRVIYEKTNISKQKFAVCCKAFRFSTKDWSLRLIEWLELLKILGVNKVFFYSLSMHKNMEKVINYYRNSV